MKSSQLVERLLCSTAKVDLHRVRRGFLSERDFPLLTAAASQLAIAKLIIDDSPGLTIAHLRSKVHKLKIERGIRLVVIDYLQLLDSSLSRDRRWTDYSELSSAIKNLAREFDIPIVVTASTKRQAMRKTVRPHLGAFEELGAVERDADMLAFVFRDEYYEADDKAIQEQAGKAELIITKQRNGPTGTVLLTFLAQYTRFETRAVAR
jgi:replicative DNA helicase